MYYKKIILYKAIFTNINWTKSTSRYASLPTLHLNVLITERMLQFWDKKFRRGTLFQRKRLNPTLADSLIKRANVKPAVWSELLQLERTATHTPPLQTTGEPNQTR